MHNATDLLNAIKKTAKEAVEADHPCDFCFGKVTSEKPLKILVEQKLTLTEAQLVLTRNVTKFETKVTVKEEFEWKTETEDGHDHKIMPKEKKIIIHNELKADDKVILIKKKGGQKYLVLDRVGKKE